VGQKINPRLLRLGPVYNWGSRWFEDKTYKETLLEDYKLREALMKKLEGAGISNIEIERSINSIKLIVYVLRPGMVIGRAGTGMEDLRKFLLSILPRKQDGKNSLPLQKKGVYISGFRNLWRFGWNLGLWAVWGGSQKQCQKSLVENVCYRQRRYVWDGCCNNNES